MIDFIFTLDYEIYGDGTGSLDELVYAPARELARCFRDQGMRFVAFVEVAELEKIEACHSDRAIELVKRQVRDLYQSGFEIALHLHPQWANARYEEGRWSLDLTEYNLCTLSRTRIAEIVAGALRYLRYLVDDGGFTPWSFRAGNWLFQPTKNAAAVLADAGIRIDSSVFKGGRQRNQQLDYRPASNNGYFWRFQDDVNRFDPEGRWIELPIYVDMVWPWQMGTAKRMSFGNSYGATVRSWREKVNRTLDFARLQYPRKLDFTRMTLEELVGITRRIIAEDRNAPGCYRPVVAIGHTKDLTDLSTVKLFLSFLHSQKVPVATFADVYPALNRAECRQAADRSSTMAEVGR